jgi:squalene-hopene/tetraprenyl-beta-curcumene cyclase
VSWLRQQRVESATQREEESWKLVEAASCAPLTLARGDEPGLVERFVALIAREQQVSGSFGHNPLSTALAIAALHRRDHAASTREAATPWRLDAQRTDGTWRFASAEVWDTALALRCLAGPRDASMTSAEAFLPRSQNDDGGSSFRVGVASDTDTTGMTLMALTRLGHTHPAIDRAIGYLRQRSVDGVWRTWHARDDVPSLDATARAVMGIARHDASAPEPRLGARWPAAHVARSPQKADWYESHPYALHELGAAAGFDAPVTARAAHARARAQHEDGAGCLMAQQRHPPRKAWPSP